MRCRYRLGGLARGTTLAAVAVSLSLGLSACQGESSVPRGAQGLQPEDTSIPAEPTPAPRPVVTVEGLESSFRLRVKSVREAQSYSDGVQEEAPGVPAVERAPAGGKLIIVTVHVANAGMAASYPESGNGPGIYELLDAQGRRYTQEMAWASNDNIQPGMSTDHVYIFGVPESVSPASLSVTLTNTSTGVPSAALLALKGA